MAVSGATEGDAAENYSLSIATGSPFSVIVIFNSRAQYLVCESCLVYVAPKELVPVLDFLAFGKEFMREYRFCRPRPFLSEALAKMIQSPRAVREPGDE